MTYQQIVELVQSLIDTIQNGTLTIGKELRSLISKTFSVRIENHQKKIEVEGQVKVDQSITHNKIGGITMAILGLKKALKPLSEIKVSNMVKIPDFPKFPDFPKEFKINNFPKEMKITSFQELVNVVGDLKGELKKVEFNPKIEVKPAKVEVNVPIQPAPKIPAPIVNVEKPDLSSITKIIEFLSEIGPKKPLAVRLSDGKTFYKALEKMAEIYAGSTFSAFQNSDGSDGRGALNKNSELRVTMSDTWSLNDVDTPTNNITYLGEETVDGLWRITKVTHVGNRDIMHYATKRNNSVAENYEYPEAWDNHASLDYGRASETL